MASNSKKKIIPVLAAFFVMGFCDIVGISSDYMQTSFGWSSTMTGFVPSMVFIWFLFLGIPIGNKMNQWGQIFSGATRTKFSTKFVYVDIQYGAVEYGSDNSRNVSAACDIQ